MRPGFRRRACKRACQPCRSRSMGRNRSSPFPTPSRGSGAWVLLQYPPEGSVVPPDPVDLAHPPLNDPPITFETDVSQVRTRVYGKGHGVPGPTDVLANEQILPVDDAVMFTPTG